MSRIGKQPITIPAGVEIKVEDGMVFVKGAKGELSQKISDLINVSIEDGVLTVSRVNDTKEAASFHGLTRTLINNMVIGVSQGFQKKLELVGVGYRAALKGKALEMQLGYSHPVVIDEIEGITFEVPSQTEILVKGIDKQKVGQVAADIRKWRKPEPYKGKGIRYEGEYIRRKLGKAAGA